MRMEATHSKLLYCHVCAQWSVASRNMTYLTCHVTSQDHVIEKWVGPLHGKLPDKCGGISIAVVET